MKIWKYSNLMIFATILSLIRITNEWTHHPQIKTGALNLYNPASGTVYSSLTPASYWVPFSGALSGPRSAGVSVTSFHTLITNDFSVNTTVQNFTNVGLRITGRVYGDTILVYLIINFIAVGDPVLFADVIFNCHLCSAISTGKGPRSENRTGTTFIVGYAALKVNVYLAGFSLHNSDGLTNTLTADSSIVSGSNVIDYQFSVTQNNTVSYLCYTTIVFCKKVTEEQLYYDWGQTGSKTLSNVAGKDPTLFIFPPGNKPDYKNYYRMFFGISAFSLSRATRRIFFMQTWNHGNLANNYQTNEGTYQVRVDYFWLARRNCNLSSPQIYFDIVSLDCYQDCGQPPVSTYNTTPGLFCAGCHYSCNTCDGSLSTNCTDCNIWLFRNPVGSSCPCNTSYIDIGYSLCYPCSVFIAGCYTCSSTVQCTACSPGFIMTASGTCQCTTGTLISGVCINITGCTNATLYGGTIYCTACNTTLNYQVTANYTCDCMSAYYMNSNAVCVSKCGDAKKANDEACDDGNIMSGDGCSPLCTIQLNWICIGGSQTSPTICYVDTVFQMLVKYVRRDTTANRIQIGIKIQPVLQQLTMTNFKRYLTHNIPCSSQTAIYENNILTLTCDYNRTIEGQTFDLSIMLDPTLFYNSKLSVSIPASGMNAKLTYDSNNTINKPLEIIVIILDVLAIIVMFASCASERMIGVEMIQTLQTVLYTQAVMKTTPSSLSPLQMLRYSSGFNEAQGVDYTRTYTFAFSLSSIGLEKEFLLSYNVMYIILMVTIVVCLLLKIKQHYHENKKVTQDEGMKNEQKWSTATKIYSFIFERILFLIAFMCMFLIVFALMLQMTSMQGSYSIMSKEFNILGGIVAIAIIATMICGVILNGCFPGILLFPMLMKQFYPPIYFVYQSTFIFVLAINYTQQYTLYILGAMSLLFLLYNVIHRPYPQKFHTFVLIFHQVLIMGAIGIYILENFTKPAEHQTLYKIGNVVVIALLYVVVFANGYRIYAYYKFLQLNGWDQYGNPTNEIYDENEIAAEYKNLQTPKALQGLRPTEQDYLNRGKDYIKPLKTQRNDDLNEMQELKKDKSSKLKPLVQDESNIKWNYNKLADDDNNLNNTKHKGASRDVKPNANSTNQEKNKPLTRSKTNDKKLDDSYDKNAGAKNLDQQFTVKNLDGKSTPIPKSKDQLLEQHPNHTFHEQNNNGSNQDQNDFDNPYDQNGYPKASGDRSKYNDLDPLSEIKRKLKLDYSAKIKNSTLKQS